MTKIPFDPTKIDTKSERYARNLTALTVVVTNLWKAGVHGDDSYGYADVEFKDLVTAASFVATLRTEVGVWTKQRTGDEQGNFLGVPVVITIPLPSDRDLFGLPGE